MMCLFCPNIVLIVVEGLQFCNQVLVGEKKYLTNRKLPQYTSRSLHVFCT